MVEGSPSTRNRLAQATEARSVGDSEGVMAQILGDEQPKRRKLDTAASSGQASSAASGPSLGLDLAAVVRLQQAQRDKCEELLHGWADNFENRCDDIQEGLDGLESEILEALDGLAWIALQPGVEPEDLNPLQSGVGPFWKGAVAYLGFWKGTVSQSSIDLRRFKELVKEHLDVGASLQASAEPMTAEPT